MNYIYSADNKQHKCQEHYFKEMLQAAFVVIALSIDIAGIAEMYCIR